MRRRLASRQRLLRNLVKASPFTPPLHPPLRAFSSYLFSRSPPPLCSRLVKALVDSERCAYHSYYERAEPLYHGTSSKALLSTSARDPNPARAVLVPLTFRRCPPLHQGTTSLLIN